MVSLGANREGRASPGERGGENDSAPAGIGEESAIWKICNAWGKMITIHLGFESGTGKRLDIPLDHTAITGRTQESGKTTTAEALVHRANVRALAFLTKRGEKGFSRARRIPPYYEDWIDAESVEAMLTSAIGEKMKFSRAEIMWLCEGHSGGRINNRYSWPAAHTLPDVLKNCEYALGKATSQDAQRLYTVLRAYLRKVVQHTAELPHSKTIELKPGINVMDLRDYPFDTQALVIRDSILRIATQEEGVVSIIPEAWKFVPQGKLSPVLKACEELIRQGGTLGNYLWLDSQDLVLNTGILRQVGVYILGVQRERNEIERVLDYIPDAYPRLKRSDIQKLDVGQFWVCFKRETTLVYVQPAWAGDTEAYLAAMNGKIIAMPAAWKAAASPKPSAEEEDAEMFQQKYEDEVAKNQRLEEEIPSAKAKIEVLETAIETTRGQLERLRNEKRHAVRGGDRAVGPDASTPNLQTASESSTDNGKFSDEMYRSLISRLSSDPSVIQLLAERPQIDVIVERPTITMDGATLPGRLAMMLADGFFTESQTHKSVSQELRRTGQGFDNRTLSLRLSELKHQGFLTAEADGYRAAPGMKARIIEVKQEL